MNYESWRIGYQDSEQAARAAFDTVRQLEKQRDGLNRLCEVDENIMDDLLKQRDELLAELEKIVQECDGPKKPYSADSYLPPPFIDNARAVIAKMKGGAA